MTINLLRRRVKALMAPSKRPRARRNRLIGVGPFQFSIRAQKKRASFGLLVVQKSVIGSVIFYTTCVPAEPISGHGIAGQADNLLPANNNHDVAPGRAAYVGNVTPAKLSVIAASPGGTRKIGGTGGPCAAQESWRLQEHGAGFKRAQNVSEVALFVSSPNWPGERPNLDSSRVKHL